MHLRCKVCAATQSVSTPDYEDEDSRTQGIRRTFRAEHLASCGAGAVSLVLRTVEATYVDPEVWNDYRDSIHVPADVITGADGFFSRTIQRDGQIHYVRVCEDCWRNIPRYVDFPAGLISPESDGAGGAVPKLRPSTVETDSPERASAAEHLWKALCLPCYLEAFQRVYPGAVCPELNANVVGDGAPVPPAPPVDAEAVGRVTVSRFGQEAAA
jgi:hypothetical protein